MNRQTITTVVLVACMISCIVSWHRTCPLPRVVDGFLTPQECQQVIQSAQRLGLERSTVVRHQPGRDRVDDSRTSSQVFLPPGDPAGDMVKARVSQLTGDPVSRMENVQVLRYGPGEEYKPHFDACDDGCDGGRNMPRKATVYIYLNEVERGGHTRFPKAGVKVQPKAGRAVHWYNMDRRTKKNITCSFHGADPVLRGEKWGCNVWIR